MKHFVYEKVLFTIGREYEALTEGLHLNWVSCQWQNYDKEVCEVEILVEPETIEKALEGDTIAREDFFLRYTYYLMSSFKPSMDN